MSVSRKLHQGNLIAVLFFMGGGYGKGIAAARNMMVYKNRLNLNGQ